MQPSDHDLLQRLDERFGALEERMDALTEEIRASLARQRGDLLAVRGEAKDALKAHEDEHRWSVGTALSVIALAVSVVVGVVAFVR